MKLVLIQFFILISNFAMAGFGASPNIGPASLVIKNDETTGLVATIEIELVKKTMNVTLWHDCHTIIPLQPGELTCASLPRIETEFKVDLINTDTQCGSKIYKGFSDKTNANGSRISITVQDNSTRTCRDFRPALVETTVKEEFVNPEIKNNYTIYTNPRL